MKIAVTLAAVVVSCVACASVNVVGPLGVTETPRVAVAFGTKDVLNRPTGLLNKNTLAMDNNVFITKSNLLFSQNDRLSLGKKAQEALDASDKKEDAAVISKNMLKAVSAPTTDAALMSKASAVVATQRENPTKLSQVMADFIASVLQQKMESEEQAIQAQAPRGVIMLTGSKDILRQPSAVVNKNMAMSDNQMTISRSQFAPTSNDAVAMTGGAKVADVIASGSSIIASPKDYRMGFMFKKPESEDDDKSEQFGMFGMPGWGFGWRYPMNYWNLYGGGLMPFGGCGLGLASGGFYYC